jgi:hypothetical protein
MTYIVDRAADIVKEQILILDLGHIVTREILIPGRPAGRHYGSEVITLLTADEEAGRRKHHADNANDESEIKPAASAEVRGWLSGPRRHRHRRLFRQFIDGDIRRTPRRPPNGQNPA